MVIPMTLLRLQSAKRLTHFLAQKDRQTFLSQIRTPPESERTSSSRHIVAIIPVYDSLGDSTDIIYTKDYVMRLPFKINTVLAKFACLHGYHLPSLRRTLPRKNFTAPLPFNSNHVLIPLKMRNNTIGNDTAYGYVNYIALRNSLQVPYYQSLLEPLPTASTTKTILHLDQASLTIYHQPDCVEQKIVEAEDIYYQYFVDKTTQIYPSLMDTLHSD